MTAMPAKKINGLEEGKMDKMKEKREPLVSIVMGSDSDLSIMKEAASILTEF